MRVSGVYRALIFFGKYFPNYRRQTDGVSRQNMLQSEYRLYFTQLTKGFHMYDIAIIGAGVVGGMLARALSA